MRLRTVRTALDTHAEVLSEGSWCRTDAPDVGALLTRSDWRALPGTGAGASGQAVTLAPVVISPGKVVCCGHNYRAHIAEMGRPQPRYPTLFTKFADTLTGPEADIVLPGPAEAVLMDWEAELAVVVGAVVRGADRHRAQQAIAGYTVANDFSVRAWQQRTSQWLPGKALEASTPLGPVLVSAEEIDPRDGLRITCRVDGVQRQAASTADLVFDAAALIVAVSEFTTLHPGDVVLTGTPGGVGAAADPPQFLRPGAVVETEIEGIGLLRNRILARPDDTRPDLDASRPAGTERIPR